eukprot:503972_1
MSSPFTKCYQLQISCCYYIPKPSYDPTNKNCIVISTHYFESRTTGGIYRYNIVTNDSEIICNYKSNTFYPVYHSQFINPSNNTLILFGGINNTFEQFDLNTNKMIIKQTNHKNMLSERDDNSQCAFIPSPINEIHVLNNCQHFKFDIINKQTVEIKPDSELRLHNIFNSKLLYIKLYNKLFVFGGNYNNKIFEYNNNKWNIKKLKMPYSE